MLTIWNLRYQSLYLVLMINPIGVLYLWFCWGLPVFCLKKICCRFFIWHIDHDRFRAVCQSQLGGTLQTGRRIHKIHRLQLACSGIPYKYESGYNQGSKNIIADLLGEFYLLFGSFACHIAIAWIFVNWQNYIGVYFLTNLNSVTRDYTFLKYGLSDTSDPLPSSKSADGWISRFVHQTIKLIRCTSKSNCTIWKWGYIL